MYRVTYHKRLFKLKAFRCGVYPKNVERGRYLFQENASRVALVLSEAKLILLISETMFLKSRF